MGEKVIEREIKEPEEEVGFLEKMHTLIAEECFKRFIVSDLENIDKEDVKDLVFIQ